MVRNRNPSRSPYRSTHEALKVVRKPLVRTYGLEGMAAITGDTTFVEAFSSFWVGRF